jgi:hypothetical protein
MTLDGLRAAMLANGVRVLLVKELAPNDNSKNQPYLGGNFEALSILPAGELRAERTEKGVEILKAPLPLFWLQPDGSVEPAPGAQLILYPQYPEIRMSGFLRGARNPPSAVMTTRDPGRLLFFGITEDRRIVGRAAAADTALAAGYRALDRLEQVGVFFRVPLRRQEEDLTSREVLLRRLADIHARNWIASYALRADGSHAPCQAPQCVGYTLEAEFGVPRNGYAEPDFMGWEVKAGQVQDYSNVPPGKVLTLMTPEPTGGHYREQGPESFVRTFGYEDKRGREDRLNFGGIFRAGAHHPGTDLTLRLRGFDSAAGTITDAAGSLALVRGEDQVAASWSFTSLAALWNRKHAQAVYVPAECRRDPVLQYRYGPVVRLGEGTDFLRLLKAIEGGAVYYDPAVKVENASSGRPQLKRRSQFRIRSGDLPLLYRDMQTVEVGRAAPPPGLRSLSG